MRNDVQMVLIINTKLQVTITLMCLKAGSRMPVVKGVPLVEPSDSLFWFNRPDLLLPLLHFILFQVCVHVYTWYDDDENELFNLSNDHVDTCFFARRIRFNWRSSVGHG